MTEAVLLSDLDESAVRNTHAAAAQLLNSSAEGSVGKATATIQMNVTSAMARAMGITL